MSAILFILVIALLFIAASNRAKDASASAEDKNLCKLHKWEYAQTEQPDVKRLKCGECKKHPGET